MSSIEIGCGVPTASIGAGGMDGSHTLEELPLPTVPLENAATTLAVILCIPFTLPGKSVRQGLHAVLPGRFQFVKRAPLTIGDCSTQSPCR